MTDSMGRNALIAGGAVLATVLATFGFGQLPLQPPEPVAPVEVEGRTTTICPAADDLAAVVASGREGGSLELGGLKAGVSQLGTTNAVTQYEELAEPLTVSAGGGQTRASAAGVHAQRDGGPDRGISLGTCTEPGGVHWFTGLGGNDEMRSVIILTNPDDAQVSVDVVFHGRDGEMATPGTRGIVVPAHETREVAVESHVSAPDLVSAQVRSRQGRVATIVADRAGGDQPKGATYASASTLPARSVVIPGVPDGPGGRRLVVVNPGDRRASVHVEILGPDGAFVPVGGEDVRVNPGASVEVDLAEGLAEQAGAVRLTSEQLVTGSVVSTSTDDPGRQDLAVQPSTPVLQGLGVAPVGVLPGVASSVVVTNAADTEAVLPLRVRNTAGEHVAENSLVVPAGSTRVWNLPESSEPGSVFADVTPGTELYAGVLLSSDKDFDRMATAPLIVPQPEAEGVEPEMDPGLG